MQSRVVRMTDNKYARSIVGALVGVEYGLEWLVSWYEPGIVSLLQRGLIALLQGAILLGVQNNFCTIPRSATDSGSPRLYIVPVMSDSHFYQGSTFIYDSYLAPYFTRNEASIDAGIASAQGSLVVFLQDRLRALWALLWSFIGQVQAAQTSQSQPGGAAPAPATGSPADVVSNLWRTYGSSVVAGITRVASGAPAPANPPSTSPSEWNSAPQSQSNSPASTPGGQPYTRPPFTASGAE
jgi:hypothetical protein